MGVHACMEADGPEVQSHFQLYIEFEGSLRHMSPPHTHGVGTDSLGEGFQGNSENNTDQCGDARL